MSEASQAPDNSIPSIPKDARSPLDNARQEAFARMIAGGALIKDAYYSAGYRGAENEEQIHKNANAIKRKPEVASRISYLQRQIVEKTTTFAAIDSVTTVAKVWEKSNEIIEAAILAEDFASAAKVMESQFKALGLYQDFEFTRASVLGELGTQQVNKPAGSEKAVSIFGDMLEEAKRRMDEGK